MEMTDGVTNFPDLSPAPQLKRALVNRLRDTLPFSLPIREEQIRGVWDVSGDITQGAGCYVSGIDTGGHNGLPGRVLVDVDLKVTVWTHLNEDACGLELDMIASGIMAALTAEDFAPPLDGWAVRHVTSWQTGDVSGDETFRTLDISATVFLQKINE